MAIKYTSNKLSLFLAEQFNESFYEPEPTSIGYVFIGNHVPYANALNAITNLPDDTTLPPDINDTWDDEISVWSNMIAAKRITGSDINIVLPVVEWTINTRYDQYDDSQEMSTKNYYVVDSTTRRVFKCLFNNNGAQSITRPTITPTSANKGVVRTAGDRYLWKYMFTYPAGSKFTSLNYIPVPLSANTSGYGVSPTYLDGGAIYNLVVENAGSGYARVTKSSIDFGANKKTIVLQNLTGVANGMYVTGTNVAANTIVESIITGTNQVVLSQNTTIAGTGTYAGVTNALTFTPRVIVEGNGSGAMPGLGGVQQLVFSGTGISKVEMATFGSGYTEANVKIFSTGTGAVIRPVLSPKFGHGYNPAKELAASSVMVAMKIGEADSTQGGIIPDTIKFRQYGFLRDPHKYGNTSPVNSFTANNVVSQLYDITLTSGDSYTINEFVYQGPDAANATFSGFVNSQTGSNIRLSRVKGLFTLGAAIIGDQSQKRRYAIKIVYPEFEPYTGDILYAENVNPVERKSAQAELLRFVLTF